MADEACCVLQAATAQPSEQRAERRARKTPVELTKRSVSCRNLHSPMQQRKQQKVPQ
jgi:hypothetical protein